MTDFSELDTLEADLRRAGLTAGVKALAVVEASAQRIETDARANAPRTRLPHYAATITHDVTLEGTMIVGEIGPDRDINGQAKLAHLFEYRDRAHLGPALDRDEPKFLASLSDVVGDVL